MNSQKEKNYITPLGHAKLLNELNQLLKVERPSVTKTIAWAAGNGDRSENADYIYGKKRLREIDKRLSFLQKRLELAVIVNPAEIKSIKVQFGATVEVMEEGDQEGRIRQFVIVGVDETELIKGAISWRSPIGSALLGKQVGDSVVVHTPSGQKEFEVMKIDYKEMV